MTGLHEPVGGLKIIQRFFDVLASISHFFRSEYSLFGLRTAIATFVGALPAFLADSATFYVDYRGSWVVVTIILILNPTAGASLGSLLFLSAGTIFGGLTAMAVWYVVDQKVPGVIVLSFVVMTIRIPSSI